MLPYVWDSIECAVLVILSIFALVMLRRPNIGMTGIGVQIFWIISNDFSRAGSAILFSLFIGLAFGYIWEEYKKYSFVYILSSLCLVFCASYLLNPIQHFYLTGIITWIAIHSMREFEEHVGWSMLHLLSAMSIFFIFISHTAYGSELGWKYEELSHLSAGLIGIYAILWILNKPPCLFNIELSHIMGIFMGVIGLMIALGQPFWIIVFFPMLMSYGAIALLARTTGHNVILQIQSIYEHSPRVIALCNTLISGAILCYLHYST
ncbi:MAG: hypothetical protein FJ161_01880 [Gammaproteobacteria bacterium]|nr:hypothetical protein [Gammaproteobacteria bacterium]